MDVCDNTPQGVQVNETGCPIDTDKDGVPDYQDKCPDVPGIAANNGCPEVKQEVKQLFRKALNGIQFASGKATILKSSYKILDDIAKTMKDNPEYNLFIKGHTDNVGKADMNLRLSKDRAESVRKYLIDKGIPEDRMHSEGYGDTMPVVPNNTSANRAKNRRVEFEVEF
jgi:outer membrane protein OmpA-like peptidoglycan-associated protein